MMKILVAEDNDSSYLLLGAIIKKEAILIRANNGQEAIDKMKSDKFDFILMDIKMPIMDGLAATRKIRQFNKNIPIIALTAYAFESDKKEAFDAGCTSYIPQPLDKETLLMAVRNGGHI